MAQGRLRNRTCARAVCGVVDLYLATKFKPQCTSVGSKHKLGNELGSQAFFGTLKLDRVMIMRGFVIGALAVAVAVAVLGYLYWDSQHNTIVKLPGVEIKKN